MNLLMNLSPKSFKPRPGKSLFSNKRGWFGLCSRQTTGELTLIELQNTLKINSELVEDYL